MKTFTAKEKSEVDLRVSQEIKNHQDFIHQTNQALQNLNNAIQCLSLRMEKFIAKSDSERKDTLIGFDNFKEQTCKECHQCSQRIGDLESKFLALQRESKEIFETISMDFLQIDDYVNRTIPDRRRLDLIEKVYRENKESLYQSLDQLRAYVDTKSSQLKQDLTPDSSKDDAIKKFLEDKLIAFKIDFEGLVTEIAQLKKSAFYEQKKIENIYTQIERLKE